MNKLTEHVFAGSETAKMRLPSMEQSREIAITNGPFRDLQVGSFTVPRGFTALFAVKHGKWEMELLGR